MFSQDDRNGAYMFMHELHWNWTNERSCIEVIGRVQHHTKDNPNRWKHFNIQKFERSKSGLFRGCEIESRVLQNASFLYFPSHFKAMLR